MNLFNSRGGRYAIGCAIGSVGSAVVILALKLHWEWDRFIFIILFDALFCGGIFVLLRGLLKGLSRW